MHLLLRRKTQEELARDMVFGTTERQGVCAMAFQHDIEVLSEYSLDVEALPGRRLVVVLAWV